MVLSKTWNPSPPANSTMTAAEAADLDNKSVRALDKSGGDTITGAVTVALGTTFTISGLLSCDGGSDVKIHNTAEVLGLMAVLAPGEIDIGDSSNLNAGTLRVTDHSTFTLDALSSTTASGPIVLTSATGKITTSGGGSIVLANNDYVKVTGGHPVQTSKRRIPFASLQIVSPFSLNAAGLGLDGSNSSSAARLPLPLGPGMWNGLAIASINLIFTPVGGHGGLPSNNIQATLRFYTPNIGGAVTLGTIGSTATYAPVSLADYNNGNAKQLALNCGTPTIDTTANCYVLEIVNENGTNSLAGNTFHALEINYTATDIRPQ